jgi:hypothetical protein
MPHVGAKAKEFVCSANTALAFSATFLLPAWQAKSST